MGYSRVTLYANVDNQFHHLIYLFHLQNHKKWLLLTTFNTILSIEKIEQPKD